MGKTLQTMQDNDSQNPGMLWVGSGKELWATDCKSCHGDVGVMRGVASRFPKFSVPLGKPINLAQQINWCRSERAKLAPLGSEHESLLALSAIIGLQSRGMPITPDTHPSSLEAARRGKTIFEQRLGQLNLSCAQCHDQRAGLRLGAAVIPEGHANGYPSYRLEWQGMGSLQRRLRNCLTGVRAELFSSEAPQWIELELHLMQRAVGLQIETPSVRP